MATFRTFYKTTVGMKPQSEAESIKKADAATDIMTSGGFSHPKPPEPAPAPEDVSSGGLASKITGGLNKMMGR